MNRALQIVTLVKTHYHGEQYAAVFNTVDEARSRGYRRTSDCDQYGYDIYEYAAPDRPYWRQEIALVLPL